jgi:RNA polymerase sigma-70 factor (ECF subfamily)
MQDTMLAMAKSLPAFEERSSISTWLYTVARSFCIKRRRKSKFAPSTLEPLEPSLKQQEEPATGEPDAALERKQVRGALEQAIARLDSDQREVLILRDIEGLSAKEVANVLSISVSAVKSRLHRARSTLRQELLPWLLPSAGSAPPSGCPDIISLYSHYLEGEIDATVCQTMQNHMAGCPRCSAECDTLKQTLAICGAASSTTVPEAVQESVRRALKAFLAGVPHAPARDQ